MVGHKLKPPGGNHLKMYLWLVSGVVWAALIVFIFTQNPFVMQDELVYRLSSLRGLDGGSSYGDYLPSLLLGLSSNCGSEFYGCVKGINVLFVLLVSLGTIALLRLSQAASLREQQLFLLAMAPVLLYASLFTPDAIYLSLGLSALVLTAALVTRQSTTLVAGLVVVLALALLTKPHALLLVAILALGSFALGISTWRFKRALAVSSAILLIPLALRLSLGWLVWGGQAINLLGEVYSNYLTTRLTAISSYLPEVLVAVGRDFNLIAADSNQTKSLAAEASSQLLLYLALLVALLTPALVALVAKWKRPSGDSLSSSLLAVSSIVLIGFVPLTVAFGSFITLNGDPHSNRVLVRYFEFAILAIYLAVITLPTGGAIRTIKKALPLLMTFGVGVASILFVEGKIDVQPFDAVLSAGFTGNSIGRWVMVSLALTVLVLTWVSPKNINRVSLAALLLLPALAVVTLMSGGRAELANFEIEARSQAASLASVDGLIVGGVNKTSAQLASFWLGNKNSRVVATSGTVFLSQEKLQDLGAVLYMNDEVALSGNFQSTSFRTEPRVVELSERLIQPLIVPGGIVTEISGVVATSSLGNWGGSSGMEVRLSRPWLEGEQLEISILTLDSKAEALEMNACGQVIPLYTEEDGVIYNFALTAPDSFACDKLTLSVGSKEAFLVLVGVERP